MVGKLNMNASEVRWKSAARSSAGSVRSADQSNVPTKVRRPQPKSSCANRFPRLRKSCTIFPGAPQHIFCLGNADALDLRASEPPGTGSRKEELSRRTPTFSPRIAAAERYRGSVERLYLHDPVVVVAADPERHRRGRVVDEHRAHVGVGRHQVLHRVAGLGIE